MWDAKRQFIWLAAGLALGTFGEARSLLVLGDEGLAVRAKTAQQPN